MFVSNYENIDQLIAKSFIEDLNRLAFNKVSNREHDVNMNCGMNNEMITDSRHLRLVYTEP
jgi:hypothetical protein